MTREEIMSMKPGRELDLLVRDKIFNLKIDYLLPIMTKEESIESCKQNNPNHLTGTVVQIIKPYSTDISAAWEVIEKLKMFSMVDGLALLLHNDYGKWYIAENEYGDLIGITSGDTAPDVICKAALLAVMEVEK